MIEKLLINKTTKETTYQSLLPQLKALIGNESDIIANMANVCAALKFSFDFLWVGFYLIKQNELVLGPFQGPVACTRIAFGKGVCGTAWQHNKVVIVDDVNLFQGHIACSPLSKSEIVLPVYNLHQEMLGVLDIDSSQYKTFDKTDEFYLKTLLTYLF